MMRCISLIFLLIFAFNVKGQERKEFEGVIRYKHSFLFTSPGIDTAEIINALGDYSIFFYKKGNYKWVIKSGDSTIEYFDDKTQTVYTRFKDNDTLFRGLKNGYNDTLIAFSQSGNKDTVCGFLCNIAETVSFTRGEPDHKVKRILIYSDAFPVGKNRFHSYRTYGSNQVIQKIKSWPLKIRLESSDMPFILTIEAIQIIPIEIPDSQVCLPAGKPIKDLPLF